MNASELFASNLALIDRVIAVVCRRARLYGADAEDFASSVKIALMEDDYAVLRKYCGRSSLEGYLAVVVKNFLYDQRSSALGRWRPSREAERLGEAAVLLETLLHRDDRALDEILPLVQRVDPSLTRRDVEEMARRLPQRPGRPRAVELEDDAPIPAREEADARVVEAARQDVSARTGRVIREQLDALADEDAMILRFRFGSGMSIADISRMLRLPQRPLYRRLESLIARLHAALDAAGLHSRDVEELIGQAEEMDFGLIPGKNDPARQSDSHRETGVAEEAR